MIPIHCPHCKRRFQIHEDLAGQLMPCPLCKNEILIGRNGPEASPAPWYAGAADLDETPDRPPPVVRNEEPEEDEDFDRTAKRAKNRSDFNDEDDLESDRNRRRRDEPDEDEPPRRKRAFRRRRKKRRPVAQDDDSPRYHTDWDSELSAGDWIIAAVCSGIGCIVGIFWIVTGNPKGTKMLALSLLFDVIKSVLWALAKR